MQGGTELRKLMFNISTMEELGEVLISRSHFRENLRTALFSLMGTVPVARGALFLHIPRRHCLELETARGVRVEPGLRIPLTDSQARTLWRQKRPVRIASPPSGLGAFVRRTLDLQRLQAVLLVPLRFKEELVGLVTVGEKYTDEPYSASDLDLLMIMANYIAIGVHNQELLRHLEKANTKLRRKVKENRQLYRNLEGIYADTVRALGAAIDAKDPYTRGHSDRVARIAVAIARTLGLPEAEVNALRIASHLHDIGKIAIDNSILLKPGRLDDLEMTQIHRHPSVSFDILSNISFPYPDVARIARHHHEWVNGSGYPDHLGPDALIPGMRIIGLADAFDAMTSDRPYRPALLLRDAVRRIREGVHAQFDVEVSKAFFRILKEEVHGTAKTHEVTSHMVSEIPAEGILDDLDTILEELGPPRISFS